MEVIAIYINIFQFTNFTYFSLSPVTRYHQENYWNVSMEISKCMINPNYTEHAARKQEHFHFLCDISRCRFFKLPYQLTTLYLKTITFICLGNVKSA